MRRLVERMIERYLRSPYDICDCFVNVVCGPVDTSATPVDLKFQRLGRCCGSDARRQVSHSSSDQMTSCTQSQQHQAPAAAECINLSPHPASHCRACCPHAQMLTARSANIACELLSVSHARCVQTIRVHLLSASRVKDHTAASPHIAQPPSHHGLTEMQGCRQDFAFRTASPERMSVKMSHY
jgi:hypothetical protein